MAFPTTGILDNFNRANEGPPPSTAWTVGADEGDTGGLSVVSSQAQVGGSFGGATWNQNFNADQEMWMTMTSLGFHQFFFRANGIGTVGLTGYSSGWDDTSTNIVVWRVSDSSTYTEILSVSGQTKVSGYKFGSRVVGTTITVFKDIGAGWVEVGNVVDAVYNAPGYIALQGGPGVTMDDFGGGSLAALRSQYLDYDYSR